MKIKIYGEEFECKAVIKGASSIKVLDENGAVIREDTGISNFDGYVMVEGEWTENETEPTEVEQLRADVDYIAIMTGVDL